LQFPNIMGSLVETQPRRYFSNQILETWRGISQLVLC